MTRTIQSRAGGAFALALAVSVCLAMLTLWLDAANDENMRWVAHTHEVARVVDRIMARASQAEASKRGFLLTDNLEFLQRYRTYIAEENDDLQRFAKLTADNRSQQRRAVELSDLWQQRLTAMNAVLALRETGRGSVQMAGLLERGTHLMDRIEAKVGEMRAEEDQLLQQRSQRQQQSQTLKRLAFAVGLAIDIWLLFWAYQKIGEYSEARDTAEREIRKANMELEQRVSERTAELKSANESLTRSNEDLTRFAFIASHDLQEPLRTVGSYAGLLARKYQGKLDPKADGYIHFIISGAKRMQNMVQDLLLYSRTGSEQLNSSSVDLRKIVDGVQQSLQVAVQESGATIVSASLPTVVGDAGKLTLVLQNLISNGIKFRSTQRAPLVRVTGRHNGPNWLIEVSDNGIGFDPEYADRIFVIFQRLHGVGEYPGTGIGLAICKRIIEAHGGRIWAESTPEIGSRFLFTLPISQEHSARTNTVNPHELQTQKG